MLARDTYGNTAWWPEADSQARILYDNVIYQIFSGVFVPVIRELCHERLATGREPVVCPALAMLMTAHKIHNATVGLCIFWGVREAYLALARSKLSPKGIITRGRTPQPRLRHARWRVSPGYFL